MLEQAKAAKHSRTTAKGGSYRLKLLRLHYATLAGLFAGAFSMHLCSTELQHYYENGGQWSVEVKTPLQLPDPRSFL